MTLIEVLAALAILSTVLAFILIARSRSMHQASLAQSTIEATSAADRLLESWWAQSPEHFPRSGRGVVSTPAQFVWETQRIATRPLNVEDMEVIRLTMKRAQELNEEALVSVDVVLPIIPPKPLPAQNVSSR